MVLQVLLGVFFFVFSGYGKAFNTWEELQRIPWIDGVTHCLMIFIGWSEMLGAIGVILPAAIKVKPVLTPLAAAGLTVIMILATGFSHHTGRVHLYDPVRGVGWHGRLYRVREIQVETDPAKRACG
jgi:uncharacterized membrane protein YphA (DoxX/SURF4 family)